MLATKGQLVETAWGLIQVSAHQQVSDDCIIGKGILPTVVSIRQQCSKSPQPGKHIFLLVRLQQPVLQLQWWWRPECGEWILKAQKEILKAEKELQYTSREHKERKKEDKMLDWWDNGQLVRIYRAEWERKLQERDTGNSEVGHSEATAL